MSVFSVSNGSAGGGVPFSQKGHLDSKRNNRRGTDSSSQLNGQGRRPKKLAHTHNNPSNGHYVEADNAYGAPQKVLPKRNQTPLQQYTAQELQATGPVVSNPQALGFKPPSNLRPARPVPRYLLHQPRLLHSALVKQVPFDLENQRIMAAMERSGGGRDYQTLYEEFQRMRDAERKEMERLGLVDAENVSKDLNDAIVFEGSCFEMCPIFERVRRALENNVKQWERDPATGVISPDRAIKAFSRPAAGQPPPLPLEVRPPQVLVKTLDYLIDNILPHLPEAHSFVWDRTRSIRQDFTYQNFYGPEAIDCNEKIVRIHLLSLHIMAGAGVEYSQQQELEQFNKALQTLLEIYKDVRNHGGSSPNEAEFRAYYLLSHLRDPEQEREIQRLPAAVLNNRFVQLALMFRNIVQQSNIVERGYSNRVGSLSMFGEFFRIIAASAHSSNVPLLMLCLLETHFNEIRFYALKSMSRSYHTKSKPYPADRLQRFLGFDTQDQLLLFARYYEVDIITDAATGRVVVDLFNKDKIQSVYKLNSIFDKPKLSPAFDQSIEQRFQADGGMQRLRTIIDCGYSNADLVIKRDAPPAAPMPNGKNGGNGVLILGGNAATLSSSAPSVAKHSPIVTANTPFGSALGSDGANIARTFGMPQQLSQPQETVPQPPQPQLPVPPGTSNVSAPIIQSGAPSKQPFTFGTPKEQQLPTPLPTKPNVATTPLYAPPEPKQHSIPAQVTEAPASGHPAQDIQTTSTSPIVSHRKRLVDSPQFDTACSQIYQELLSKVISEELYKVLPKMVQQQRASMQRSELINSVAQMAYSQMLSKAMREKLMEVQAVHRYDTHVKRKGIKAIIKKAVACKTRQQLKAGKLRELELVLFRHLHKHKRHASFDSNLSMASAKRIKYEPTLDESYIDESQKSVLSLWEPFSLEAFAKKLSSKIRLRLESQNLQLKVLLVVEDWSSSYSKWLNSKLRLVANLESVSLERLVQTDKLNLTITSLPLKYSISQYFAKTPFVIFECGQTQKNAKQTLMQKLHKDEVNLAKLVALFAKYSLYKVQLILLYWDISESGLSTSDIRSTLNLATLASLNADCIQSLTLCDMTASDADINQNLKDVFDYFSKGFKGELTTRGERKVLKLRQSSKVPACQETPKELDLTSPQLRPLAEAREKDQVAEALAMRKYDYLARHVTNTSINDTANQSSFVTARNTSLHPTSLWAPSHKATHDYFPNTILNRSTFNNTTVNNDKSYNESILAGFGGGFGGGFVGESTPFSTPGKRAGSIRKPGSANLPKGLDELRALTQGIKRKFSRAGK